MSDRIPLEKNEVTRLDQASQPDIIMLVLLSLSYILLALLLGAYTTYLLATLVPESLLEEASGSGRFAGLCDGPVEHPARARAPDMTRNPARSGR